MKRFNTKHIGLTALLLVIIVGFVLWLMLKDRGEYLAQQPRNTIEAGIITNNRMNVTLIAKEPDIINPMTMCVDRKGAIYVSESFTYRYGLKGSPSQDTLTLNPIKRIELDSAGRLSKVTIVAQGFANPVMGIDIFRNKLYATCLNELFVMDIEPDGKLSNKQVLVKDSANPWNPFGMYRVAVGPDAKLWLAIADHPDSKPVTLTGSDGTELQLRGQSGGFVRCNLDGSDLQLVVQGFRAPFAFDVDPWGHLWAISNGESSPNIYVDVIPGMDYGYHSRRVPYAWLAGKTNLSPPVTEMGSGANTVALHYYSSMFPSGDYWGNILIANWGSHGAYPNNRTIKRFVPKQYPTTDSIPLVGEYYRPVPDTFVSSSDSLFRPVGMTIAPDGGLYLADWYGQDDESDSTGRIFKLSYIGRTSRQNQYDPEKIAGMSIKQLCGLLGNPNKFIRLEARERLVVAGAEAVPVLERLLKKGDAYEAAQSIWTLTQLGDSAAAEAMTAGLKHKDPRIRALALRQLRQASGEPIGGAFFSTSDTTLPTVKKALFSRPVLATLAAALMNDPDQEVRLEAALSQNSAEAVNRGLLSALEVAVSKRIRYQIGFELGRYGDSATIMSLYDTTHPVKYRAALVAAQTALHEQTALAGLVKDWDFSKEEDIGKYLVAQIEAGKKQPDQPAERLITLNWLEEHPRVPNASLLSFLQDCLKDEDYLVKGAALQVVRQRLLQDEAIQQTVRDIMRKPDTLFRFLPVEALYTVGSFADPGPAEDWLTRLNDSTENIVTATLRALRRQPREPDFIDSIWGDALKAAQRYPALHEEFRFAFKKAGLDEARLKQLPPPPSRPVDKAALSKAISAQLPQGSSRRGKWSFNESCVTCHSTYFDDSQFRLGPNLADIGASSQPAYLIESILEPNKVLKTGYQMETIETKDGKTYNGQVETAGNDILIRNAGAPPVTISMTEIKKRTTSHLSPMPDGLYHNMTLKELTDLIAYLVSLKGSN